jgi:hypothetical protein
MMLEDILKLLEILLAAIQQLQSWGIFDMFDTRLAI